jgi:uncharacterized membrane protein
MNQSFKKLVGVFANAQDAESALREVNSTGFPMKQVSLIARHTDTIHDVTQTRTVDKNPAQEATTSGAVVGGAIGGTIGLLVGLGTVAAIPGVGPLVLLGEAAVALVTTLTSSVMGATAGGLLGALVGQGIPEDHATSYHNRVERGEYLAMVEGTEADLSRIAAIFDRWHAKEVRTYPIPSTPVPAHQSML